MGVARRVIKWLRDQGYDFRHLREEELQLLPDDQIFRKAVAENRVVLTLDLDFSEIVAFSGQQNVSVVTFSITEHSRSSRYRPSAGRFIRGLSALEQGTVVVVEESRFRIGRLSIGR